MRKWIKGDISVQIISIIIVTLFAACCLLPFLYVFFTSFMPYSEYMEDPLRMFPSRIDLSAYKQLLEYKLLHTSYMNSIFVTLTGTILNIIVLVMSAYPLSKKNLKGHRLFMGAITFTMFFNGGMIPNYILIRGLHLNNTLWAMILPGAFSAFNLILMKNFILTSIPSTLEEAARIDGANEIKILTAVITPLLKPAIATMIVFCSVGYWNEYYSAMLYVTDRKKWPLTLLLRELIVEDTAAAMSQTAQLLNMSNRAHSFTLKMAAIIITILPILIVYPFMQKHFVKGVTLGAIKE